MSSAVEDFVLRRIAEAPILEDPFPHCVIDGVFPEDFYEDLIDHWPRPEDWISLSSTGRTRNNSEQRLVVLMQEPDLSRLFAETGSFWRAEVAAWLMRARFGLALLHKFERHLRDSGFMAEPATARADALIVSDRTDYALGPHTDAPHRVVSCLFYLPEDAAFRRYGTSLYEPADGTFRCAGGPHHKAKFFRRVTTVEFLPNRLVMFPKSDRCFHGVERVDLAGMERRLLIYNLRRGSAPPAA